MFENIEKNNFFKYSKHRLKVLAKRKTQNTSKQA